MKKNKPTKAEPVSPDESGYPQSFDTFPKTTTMPDKWDLSEMTTPGQSYQGRNAREADVSAHDHLAESNPRDSLSEGDEPARPEWLRNLFPEPRTIPRHWRFHR